MEGYLALFEPDLEAGGYTVTFPDFGYGVTQGETAAEAMEMAQDLLMLTIGDYIREGKPVPAPAFRRGAKFRPVRRRRCDPPKSRCLPAELEFRERISIDCCGSKRLHVEARDAA